jgi:hypothetical protein
LLPDVHVTSGNVRVSVVPHHVTGNHGAGLSRPISGDSPQNGPQTRSHRGPIRRPSSFHR